MDTATLAGRQPSAAARPAIWSHQRSAHGAGRVAPDGRHLLRTTCMAGGGGCGTVQLCRGADPSLATALQQQCRFSTGLAAADLATCFASTAATHPGILFCVLASTPMAEDILLCALQQQLLQLPQQAPHSSSSLPKLLLWSASTSCRTLLCPAAAALCRDAISPCGSPPLPA